MKDLPRSLGSSTTILCHGLEGPDVGGDAQTSDCVGIEVTLGSCQAVPARGGATSFIELEARGSCERKTRLGNPLLLQNGLFLELSGRLFSAYI